MYKIKEYEKIQVNVAQEIVVGHMAAFDREYVAIRSRVPGDEDSHGVMFDAARLDEVIEALTHLHGFLGPGQGAPGEGQQSFDFGAEK